MKSSIISLLLSGILFFPSSAQVTNAAQNVKDQASKMGRAFMNADYATFAHYTYPLVLKLMGGPTKMAEMLSKTTDDFRAKGMTISSVSFGEPSKIVKSGRELQSTIIQHTEVKLSQGRIVSTSTLIAISVDNGVDWTFIDTSNKDMATLRKLLPNLSHDIIIPKQLPPERYNL